MTSAQVSRFIAYLILIAGMVICRAGYLDDVIYNIDEAEYVVAADALDYGWLPGVDLLGSTKPPGIAILYNVLFHIFGRSMSVIHAAHLVIMILAGVFVIEIARKLWGLTATIPAALLFWITSNTFSLPSEMVALNVESPGLLFTCLALWLIWQGSDRAGAILLAGAALGIAILFRQSFVFFLIPAIYVVAAQTQRRHAFIQFFIGVTLPWIPVFASYVLRGDSGWALDSWIRYPLMYSSDLGWFGFFEAFWRNLLEFSGQEFPLLLLAVIGLLPLWKQRRAQRSRFLLLLAIGSFLALASGSRFFGHYWIQIFPVLVLLATAGWMYLAEGRKHLRLALGVLIVIAGLLALRRYPLWREWDPYAAPKGVSPYALGSSQAELSLGAFARDSTRADETIVVWGYCPQIYYHASRLPGVRDYLCHYTTGFSAATFSPLYERSARPYGHPQAQEMFVADLKERRPKYIIDISSIMEYEFPFVQYPLTSYRDIAAYIRANYVPEIEMNGAYIYRLRTTSQIP